MGCASGDPLFNTTQGDPLIDSGQPIQAQVTTQPDRDQPSPDSQTVIRQNYGVVFEKLPQNLLVHENLFNAVLIIPRTSVLYLPPMKNLWGADCNTYPPCTSVIPILHNLEQTHSDLRSELDKLAIAMKMLFPRPVPVKRARTPRGLINGVGIIAKYLFGVSTIRDTQNLADKISKLHSKIEQSQRDYVEISEDVAKLANSSAESISGLSDQLQKQISHVRQATFINEQHLQNITSSMRHRIVFLQNLEVLTTTCTFHFRAIDLYINKVNDLIEAIERLQTGVLSSLLVSPDELQHTLNKVHSKALNSGMYLVHKDLDFYYTHALAGFMYTQTHFYVHLKIPVSRELAWYSLYQVHIFGIPSQSKNLQAYTKLLSDVSLLAISYDEEYFMEISKQNRNHCRGTDMLQCSVIPNYIHVSHPTCLYAIYSNSVQQATSHCNHFAYFNQEAPLYIHKLPHSQVLVVSGSAPVNIICNETQRVSCSICKITLPCNCEIVTHSNRVYPDANACAKIETFKFEHGLNMALAHAFSLSLPNNSLLADTSNESYQLVLPSLIDLYKEDTLPLHAGIGLKRLAKEIQNRTRERVLKAQRTWASHFYDKAVEIMDPTVWIGFLVLAFSALLQAYIILKLCRRQRKLAVAVSVLNKISYGYGKVIERITTTQSPAEKGILEELSSLDSISNFAAFIVGVYLLSKLFRYFWNKRKAFLGTKSGYGFMESQAGLKILLKIGTPEAHEIVCLHEFMTKMDDQTFFEVPRLLSLTIRKSCLKYSLNMIWSTPLTRTDGKTCTTTYLPKALPLPFGVGRKLLSIRGNRDEMSTMSVLLVHRGTAERLKSSQMPVAKAIRQAEVLPTGVISDISRQNREEKQRRRQLHEATVARPGVSGEMVVKVTPPPYLSHNNLAGKLNKESGMPIPSAPEKVMEGGGVCPAFWATQPTDPLFSPYSDDEYASDY